MFTKAFRVLLGVALALALTHVAEADCPNCVTCHDFCTNGSAYSMSPPPFSGCNVGKDCGVVAPVRVSFVQSLHPGILTANRRDGVLLVTAVLPGSPAKLAGIEPNDEIISLNGETKPAASCRFHSWLPRDGERTASIVYLRHGARHHARVELIEINRLLTAAWLSAPRLVSVAEKTVRVGAATWTYGLKTIRKGTAFEITDVMIGSPAQMRGLRVGDRIVAIDGLSASEVPIDVQMLNEPQNPGAIRLVIAREPSHELTLQAVGFSSALRLYLEHAAASGANSIRASLF